jgi:hypothetical protein
MVHCLRLYCSVTVCIKPQCCSNWFYLCLHVDWMERYSYAFGPLDKQYVYLGTVQHVYLGTVQHAYLGTVQHVYLGTVQHAYLGTVQHVYLGTVQNRNFFISSPP